MAAQLDLLIDGVGYVQAFHLKIEPLGREYHGGADPLVQKAAAFCGAERGEVEQVIDLIGPIALRCATYLDR